MLHFKLPESRTDKSKAVSEVRVLLSLLTMHVGSQKILFNTSSSNWTWCYSPKVDSPALQNLSCVVLTLGNLRQPIKTIPQHKIPCSTRLLVLHIFLITMQLHDPSLEDKLYKIQALEEGPVSKDNVRKFMSRLY